MNGHRMLIDGGRSGTTIVGRLRRLGVTSLDAIVATHPDADHAGGLSAVLGAFSVGRIYVDGDPSSTETYAAFLAAAADEPGAQVITVVRGQMIPLGGHDLRVLNPASPTGDTNNDSIVLELRCGVVGVLFTGDAEVPAEESMIAAGLVAHVNVLKVSHHGSATGTSSAFLDAVRPEVAVISAGRTNQYGHPAPETMARIASAGVRVEYTDTGPQDDSVTMKSDCRTYSFSRPPVAVTVLVAPGTSDGTVPQDAAAPGETPRDGGPWHTSAAASASFYYCEADPGWRSLSVANLRSYDTEAALLGAFPGRAKHPYPGC